MKRIFNILIILFLPLSLFSAENGVKNDVASKNVRNYIKKGNNEYKNKHYAQAETLYKLALQEDPNSQIAKFNLALALLKQNPVSADDTNSQEDTKEGKTSQIQDPISLLQEISESSNKTLAEKALVGLGNAAFNKKDYRGSIEYYKKALRIDSDDMVARKNLRVAQILLPPDQPQDNNNQNQQDSQNDQNKDQNNGGGQNNQDNQDKKDQDNKNNQQNDNSQGDNQNQSQNNQQAGGQQQKSSMSKENIDKILQATQRQEDKTRQKVEKEKQGNGTRSTIKPW